MSSSPPIHTVVLYPGRFGAIVVAISKSIGTVTIILTPAFSNCLLISSENKILIVIQMVIETLDIHTNKTNYIYLYNNQEKYSPGVYKGLAKVTMSPASIAP